ncbi:MAG: phage terminase large subunit family protein [Campylobacteraceae bacterium]|nr:phage terminase large subunit family protein [Campylobacteraceae bacterium]
MMNNIGVYKNSFLNGLLPDPLFKISKWADERRQLPKKSSSEPGQWRTSRFPFVREIMDVLGPQNPIQQVKVKKGTQIGGTEIGNNFLMCYMDIYPCPMMLVMPTEGLMKKHRIFKLVPSLELMPNIANKIKRGKTKDDIGTADSMEFPGGMLVFGWSNSTAQGRSLSFKVLDLDDIDGFPHDLNGEGSAISVFKKRTDAFPNRKIYLNSTPTVKGRSNIEIEYDESDQREYHVVCPSCKGLFYFTKDTFIFEYDQETYRLTNDVKACCHKCGTLIEEHHKTWMMDEKNGAKWIATNEGHPHAGFNIPSYYSPMLTWNEIFTEFLEAKKKMNQGNVTLMKTWTNTRDANVWEENYEKVDTHKFDTRCELYTSEVPEGVLVITAGIDTQDNRLEVEIVGWGKYGESWSIDYLVLDGDPKYPNVWEKLDMHLLDRTYKHESGIDLKVMAACIDTGGHRTKYVYAYCKKRFELNIFAIKGDKGINTPTIKGNATRNNTGKIPLFSVGVNTTKDVLHTNLMTEDAGAGYMHFPKREKSDKKFIYDSKYFKQLTAEKRGDDGRWVKFRTRNEGVDCRVYSMAALELIEMMYYPQGMDWDVLEDEFHEKIENELNAITNEEEENEERPQNYNDWRDNY